MGAPGKFFEKIFAKSAGERRMLVARSKKKTPVVQMDNGGLKKGDGVRHTLVPNCWTLGAPSEDGLPAPRRYSPWLYGVPAS